MRYYTWHAYVLLQEELHDMREELISLKEQQDNSVTREAVQDAVTRGHAMAGRASTVGATSSGTALDTIREDLGVLRERRRQNAEATKV